ncbi:MAG: glycosyltransferase family 4 protein [Nitrospirota bacterium]
MDEKIKILVFVDYYLPGYKSGGPIRSIFNIVERLGDEFIFKIITRAHDYGDLTPYPHIEVDSWQPCGKAEVIYLSPEKITFKNLRLIILDTEHDIAYLNSFFSPAFTFKPLLLRLINLIPQKPFIVAPRGEFSRGALSIKRFKKKIYLYCTKLIGLYNKVFWHATSIYEEADIRQSFNPHITIITANDMPAPIHIRRGYRKMHEKKVGFLKIAFLSRIARMKNLDSALRILKNIKGNIQFNIYGIKEDDDYWKECESIIRKLPENIRVEYHGCVEHDNVASVFEQHDILFLPSMGENFGHVILEAMLAGCPVLISDKTPWRDLEAKHVGWDLPLDEPERFREILQLLIDMDKSSFETWTKTAYEYGFMISRSEDIEMQTRNMFALVKTNRI